MSFGDFCKAGFVVLFLIATGAWMGYSFRDYQVVTQELTNEKAVSVAKDAYQEGLQNLSTNYKNDLKDVLKNNKHTREVITREKTKPVFLNRCTSDDYIGLFNSQSEQYLQKLPSDSKG